MSRHKDFVQGGFTFVIFCGAVCWTDSDWQKQPQINLANPDPVLYVQGVGTLRTDPTRLESHSLLQDEFSFSHRVSSYSLREWEDKKNSKWLVCSAKLVILQNIAAIFEVMKYFRHKERTGKELAHCCTIFFCEI